MTYSSPTPDFKANLLQILNTTIAPFFSMSAGRLAEYAASLAPHLAKLHIGPERLREICQRLASEMDENRASIPKPKAFLRIAHVLDEANRAPAQAAARRRGCDACVAGIVPSWGAISWDWAATPETVYVFTKSCAKCNPEQAGRDGESTVTVSHRLKILKPYELQELVDAGKYQIDPAFEPYYRRWLDQPLFEVQAGQSATGIAEPAF